MIVIVDFGSQTTHLIARRLKEMSVSSTIVLPEKSLTVVAAQKPAGIILSGGPSSVYEKNAPLIDKKIFNTGIPIFCICYGLQLITHVLGGKVTVGHKKEFGPARLRLTHASPLTEEIVPPSFVVWMSHADEVMKVPSGFMTAGKTDTIAHAYIFHPSKKIYGIQFHPEVIHTQFGEAILSNFATICGLSPHKKPLTKDEIVKLIQDIHDSVGASSRVICALSGGVDSSTAAVLVHKAIGMRLTAIYIDSGLMRKHETEELKNIFRAHFHMKIKIIRAGAIFLKALQGVVDPEKKRRIIGRTFIRVFEKEARKLRAQFLVQGTIYPDVIESAGTKHSHKIKTHHNGGGLPKNMHVTLLEPLRSFYKDEVRTIGTLLGLPSEIVDRQPFPGPGLAIRIIGNVTETKLKIVRGADHIIQEEIKKAHQTPLWPHAY